MACINKNLREYQALHEMSGIPEVILDFYCNDYLEKFNRLPELDELPHVNTESYLKESLQSKQIDDIDFVKNSNIREKIGANSAEDATVRINNIYKDLEVKVIPITAEKSMLDIRHRPSKFVDIQEDINLDYDMSSANEKIILRQMLSRMRELYGISIVELDNSELEQSGILQQIPDAANARAFVFNGNIYLNSDLATLDAPVHELLHIFLGAMRFTNPTLYSTLLEKVTKFETLPDIAKRYPNRTENDLLEEVFVTEYANYLVGNSSEFNKYTKEELSRIIYEITRNLDTMLMGNTSITTLAAEEIFNSSLLQLAGKVQSSEFNKTTLNMMDLADLHRKTANYKSQLMQNGDLEEKCN